MKEIRRNIRMLAALLLCLFIGFGVYFSYSVYFFGGRWFANPYNPRLSSQKQVVRTGSVTDREGTLLAYTDDAGARHYAQSGDTRRAVSHVIGDNGGNVANGVETFHAQYLLGFKANIAERIVQLFQGGERRGDDIQLTLSAQLNTYISEGFPKGQSGAVVILNYRTGDIYAMVSKPDFDPVGIEAAKQAEGSPLLNRATQGRYPPGSTFKIVTLAAVLNNLPDAQARQYECTGRLQVEKSVVTDAGNNVHGVMSLQDAFAKSCNVTFAGLTRELGYKKMSDEAQEFGVGDNFLFRDMVVYNSEYPADNLSEDDLAWSGIGQGRVLVTPLHMAMTAASVANGGVMMEPRLILRVTGPQGQRRLLTGAKVYRRAMSPEVAAILYEDMISVVQTGTGGGARMSGLRVGGKTGSAEAVNDKTIQPHAWYVGFVDDPQHPLAIAVIVERSGSGGQVAAPLAKKFLTKAISLGL